MDGNSSSPSLLWEAPDSNFFPINGLAFDPKDQVLFWTYLNCSYKYQTQDKLLKTIFCDSDHMFSIPPVDSDFTPTLLSYFNRNLFILIPMHGDVSYANEHSQPASERTGIAFFFGPQHETGSGNGPVTTSVQDLLIVDSSIQPGGCGPLYSI